MSNAPQILMSLEARHALNIFNGNKEVELRRRAMHVVPGTLMWLYVKLPVGAVLGYVKIDKKFEMAPQAAWRRFGGVSGLTRKEFFTYFSGAELATVLVVSSPTLLHSAVTLDSLRLGNKSFHPPQFFARMHSDHPLRKRVDGMSKRGEKMEVAGSAVTGS